MSEKPRCIDCRYYEPIQGMEKIGECRIDPPRAPATQPKDWRREVYIAPVIAISPDFWCGQWEQKQ